MENSRIVSQTKPASTSGQYLIKTDGNKQSSRNVNSADNSDEINDSEDQGESKSKSLSDVWVFDSHLKRWFELHPPLYIQGSGAGKRIRK